LAAIGTGVSVNIKGAAREQKQDGMFLHVIAINASAVGKGKDAIGGKPVGLEPWTDKGKFAARKIKDPDL
jgi:hypothetical protein